VETRIFPLYEVTDGLRYRLTHRSAGPPVEAYLSLQGRYHHLTAEQIRGIQSETDRSWERLTQRCDGSGPINGASRPGTLIG